MQDGGYGLQRISLLGGSRIEERRRASRASPSEHRSARMRVSRLRTPHGHASCSYHPSSTLAYATPIPTNGLIPSPSYAKATNKWSKTPSLPSSWGQRFGANKTGTSSH